MDFKLSEEEKLVQETAARFVRREMLPLEGPFLKQDRPFLPPGDPPRRVLEPRLLTTLSEKARDAGLWALELPEDSGGPGLSFVARALIYREFGKTALPFEPPPIPTVTKKSPYARKISEGVLSLSLAFEEIHKSGDLTEIRVSYRELPEGFVLNGPETDLLNPNADLYLLPAREEGSRRIGLFLLERNASGLRVKDEAEMTTDQTVARLTLSDCGTAKNQLAGDEEDAREIVAAEQLRIAARSLGIGIRCLGDSVEHARNRVTFGRPLSSRQAIQWMVADLSVNLRSCIWLTLQAAWRADQGLPYFDAAALAKKRAARMAFEAADTAIQIHGGYGVCKEFPFETFYREARLLRLLYGREAAMDRAVAMRAMAAESF